MWVNRSRGPDNLDGDTIKLVPQKGSKNELLVLPITRALMDALRDVPEGHDTFLTTEYGKPFSSNGFGNKMRDWCNAAGLKQCSSHGLRKSAATVLAEAGAGRPAQARSARAVFRHVATRVAQRLASLRGSSFSLVDSYRTTGWDPTKERWRG